MHKHFLLIISTTHHNATQNFPLLFWLIQDTCRFIHAENTLMSIHLLIQIARVHIRHMIFFNRLMPIRNVKIKFYRIISTMLLSFDWAWLDHDNQIEQQYGLDLYLRNEHTFLSFSCSVLGSKVPHFRKAFRLVHLILMEWKIGI